MAKDVFVYESGGEFFVTPPVLVVDPPGPAGAFDAVNFHAIDVDVVAVVLPGLKVLQGGNEKGPFGIAKNATEFNLEVKLPPGIAKKVHSYSVLCKTDDGVKLAKGNSDPRIILR